MGQDFRRAGVRDVLGACLGGNPMSWTDEAVAKAKKLRFEGKSCAQIAKALGPEFSRSAVIGKFKRLKIAFSPGAVRASQSSPPSKFRVKVNNNQTYEPAPVQPLPNLKTAPMQCDPVSLVDLTPHQCRWPVTDDFMFCGATKSPGDQSWCAAHVKIGRITPKLTPGRLARSLRKFT